MSPARTIGEATTGPLADPPVWSEMAELLCGPLTGHALLIELRNRYPHAKRDDVYRAIATAWTYHQAGHLADFLELESVKRAGRRP